MGNNRLNAHIQMKLVASSMYTCNIEDQTTEHILQRCPNHITIRNQPGPDNTTLQQGGVGSLELLVSFINLAYQCSQANKKKNIYISSKKTQPARGWNAADICTNCVYTIPAPRDGGPIPLFGQAVRRSLPPGGGRRVKSLPGDTNKHTPVIWICDLCHKQINKKQTSIRCNNTHWVHLICTQIKQRQYKHD